MRRTTVFLLVFTFLAGLIIVALPDNDERVIQFSKSHGPSLMDCIGLVVMLIPYFILVHAAWVRRYKINKQGKPLLNTCIFLAGLGSGLIIASVFGDFNLWWIAGAVLMALPQVYIFYLVFK